jgi:hypothetical protein
MTDNWSIRTAHKGVALGAGVYSPQDERYGAERLMVQTHTQNVWYTLDGSTPSATNGFVLLATQPPIIINVGAGVIPNFLRAASGAVLQYQWIE